MFESAVHAFDEGMGGLSDGLRAVVFARGSGINEALVDAFEVERQLMELLGGTMIRQLNLYTHSAELLSMESAFYELVTCMSNLDYACLHSINAFDWISFDRETCTGDTHYQFDDWISNAVNSA
mgnify:CR=1 FL=1